MNIEQILNEVITWVSTKGITLVIGLIALFISFKVINAIARGVRKSLTKRNVDRTIVNLVYNIIRKGIKIILFVVFLGIIGIDTAGIGAAIGSSLVAIGLALQGSLSNLAGGVILLILRPFKLGDYIEAQGEGGTVDEIGIFYTKIITPDNKVVLIPNGTLANNNIKNYSTKDTRRVDVIFSIAYENDTNLAINLIQKVCASYTEILKDNEPFVKVSEYGASSINIVTRVWVKTDDYWTVHFKLLEDVKKEFDKNGISIPFNQLDIQIKK